MKFKLKVGRILQGDFTPAKLNMLLVFQVNCPGCFIYALPVACELYKNHPPKDVKIMALSTAFEDYELNTLENTQRFLDHGELIGETKKTLKSAGKSNFPYRILFPVAFDQLETAKPKDLEKEIEYYCKSLDGFKNATPEEQTNLRQQVRHYLENKTHSAYTFDSNRLKGTPTWILFDKDFNLYYEAFGHKDYSALEREITKVRSIF